MVAAQAAPPSAAAVTPPTLCGASFAASATQTYQQAFAAENARFGGLDTVRVFYPGLPQPWPGKLNAGTHLGGISFQPPPPEVLSGRDDAALASWFRTAPRAIDTYWSYQHEPEDDIAAHRFTAAQYRAAWQRIAGLAVQAHNPRLHATLILMGFTLTPASGRHWQDYYPGPAVIEVLAWDTYNHADRGLYHTPADLYGPAVAVSRSVGKRFAIAETGSALVAGDKGAGRGAWLRAVTSYLIGQGAVFASYFDLDWRAHGGPDYRLTDAPSQAAWRAFCTLH
jgi:hypothetical protein